MAVEQVIGKREQNKEKVRSLLISEATLLFSEKGYENTTVADIVTASTVGRGTFYNYFSDVKDIFDAVVAGINNQLRIVTKEARSKESDLAKMLYASFKAYFDYVSSPDLKGFHDKNQAYIRSASYKSDTIRQVVKDLREDLNQFQEVDDFVTDKTFSLLTYVLLGTPAELFLNNMSVSSSYSNHEVATFLTTLFTNGLGQAK